MKKVAKKGAVDRARIKKIKELAKGKYNGLVPQAEVDTILNLKTPMIWYRKQAGKGVLRRWVDKSGAAYIQPVIDKMANVIVGYAEDYARKKDYPVNRNTAKQSATINFVKSCKDGRIHLSGLVAWMKDNFKAQSTKEGTVNQDKRMVSAIDGYVKKGRLVRVTTLTGILIMHPSACSKPEQTCAKVEYRKPEQLSLFSPEQLRSSGEDHVSNELLVKLIKEVQAARVEINKVMSMLETDRARMGAASMAFAKTFSGR